jgi:hypothetical protein
MKLPPIFVMTLQHCDMTYGQVTRGAKPRGAEAHIPIKARHMMPEFFGWPDKYSRPENPKPSQINQRNREITVEFRGIKYDSWLWGYANKTEFRFRLEEVRAAIKEPDDLLMMDSRSELGCDYWVEVIYKDHPDYKNLFKNCTHKAPVANSVKFFNYFDEGLKPVNPRRELFVVVHHRDDVEDYTSFRLQKDANDLSKAISKSNGITEVIPFLEQIEP